MTEITPIENENVFIIETTEQTQGSKQRALNAIKSDIILIIILC